MKRHQAEQAALVADALGQSVREELRRQRESAKPPAMPATA
jgi:2-oxoglutarate dehydrogenase E1 component